MSQMIITTLMTKVMKKYNQKVMTSTKDQKDDVDNSATTNHGTESGQTAQSNLIM